MINKLISWFFFGMLATSQKASGQDSLRLSHKEFMAIVKQFHPMAFRYRIETNIAAAAIQKARGSFDPLLGGKDGAKTLDGVNYYEESNVAMTIPAWYGIELNGSYNNLQGQKLDNSETEGVLYQFGVTVPLSRNLLYDKRRAMLEQARYALTMTEAEQRLLTNELLLDAENTYWNWVRAYELFLLQTNTVEVNRSRMRLVMKTYQYGELAAIDTTEALSQLQGFELQEKEALLQFVKATQELQLFLWRENQELYPLNPLLVPSDKLDQAAVYDTFPALLREIEGKSPDRHNALLYYLQKQRLLDSERRLKRQDLLPKLDFTYNFLNKGDYKAKYLPLFNNNYRYGLKLEIPLFLRQARADYRIAKFKITQNRLDAQFKRQELLTKIQATRNEVINYRSQILLAEQNINNYERLLNAEITRFSNGESSLFIINSRENKLMEFREKQITLRSKFLKACSQLKWMNENFAGN